MRLKNGFIIAWWVFLLVSFLVLIYKRFDIILSKQVMPFDYLILILFFLLSFLPFFSEMSMFGVKIKKDLEKVEASVESVKELISNNVKNSNHIYVNQPHLSEEEQSQFKEAFHAVEEPSSIFFDSLIARERTAVELFIIRLGIEKEIKRISVNHLVEPYRMPIRDLIKILANKGILEAGMANALIEIYSITSIAIHADEVIESQSDFALTLGPTLIEKLKSNNISFN